MKINLAKIAGIFYRIAPKRPIRFVCGLFLGQVIQAEKIINFGCEKKHVFFGYYDINPFSQDDKLLLAMRTPLIGRASNAEDYAEVGYFCIGDSERGFFSLGKTNAWCWQQGCRLQWYPQGGDKILYNRIIDGKYGAIIKNISGDEIKKINRPLYSISPDGKWGLSLDFSRLQRLRPGYGYGVLLDASAGRLKPDDNCIELVDIEASRTRRLFSLKDITEIEPHDSMEEAEHYFNHIMFNPSGEKFLFFHLWVSKKGKRHSRLFVAGRDGSDVKLLNNSGSVSHYNWVSDDKIILYSLVGDKDKYMYAIFDSSNGNVEYFGKNAPKNDGHPTFLKSGDLFVADTYPNLCSQRNLISYNPEKDLKKVLARFDDSRDFTGELRCDLHPRISRGEKMICVDRLSGGKRIISIIPFNTDEL